MKKMYMLLLLLAAGLTFTACSDDDIDNPYARESTIVVEKSNLDFTAAGGTGTVSVNVAQGVTAKSSVSWATPTVNGAEITVTVEPSTTAYGRTGLITIYNGKDSTQVNVHQSGVIFRGDIPENWALKNDAEDLRFTVVHTGEITIESDADWVTGEVVGDTIILHAAANTSGAGRQTEVRIKCGSVTKTITVVQMSVESLYGLEYKFMGIGSLLPEAYGGPYGTTDVYTAHLLKEGNQTYLEIIPTGDVPEKLKIPVSIDPVTFNMTILPSAKDVGSYSLWGFLDFYYNLAFASFDDIENTLYYGTDKPMVGEATVIDAKTVAWTFDGELPTMSFRRSDVSNNTDASDGQSFKNFVYPFLYCGNINPSDALGQ